MTWRSAYPLSPLRNSAALSGRNVLVNSVPGSGKTTAACIVAKEEPSWKCLLLTYNKRLKEDTRARRDRLDLKKNLEVHSFHAMGVHYWSSRCKDDEGLKEVVEHNLAPSRGIPGYDLIIIDETQDVTPLLFCFLNAVCRQVAAARVAASLPPLKLMCVGDGMQSIFQFRHSDKRFLRLADHVMPLRGAFRVSLLAGGMIYTATDFPCVPMQR